MTTRFRAIIGFLTLSLIGSPGWAAERDPAVARQFQRLNPCPSTGLKTGPCPGWNKDHRDSLCMGGPDTVANLQWLRIEDHRAKTLLDVRACRMIRNLE